MTTTTTTFTATRAPAGFPGEPYSSKRHNHQQQQQQYYYQQQQRHSHHPTSGSTALAEDDPYALRRVALARLGRPMVKPVPERPSSYPSIGSALRKGSHHRVRARTL